jgi:hypothetical protein
LIYDETHNSNTSFHKTGSGRTAKKAGGMQSGKKRAAALFFLKMLNLFK